MVCHESDTGHVYHKSPYKSDSKETLKDLKVWIKLSGTKFISLKYINV